MDLFRKLYGHIPGLDEILRKRGGTLQTRPNIFGGQNLTTGTGEILAQTKPNIMGGEDVLSPGHNLIASSRPNIHGGEDLMSPDHQVHVSSQPNIHGGEDLYTPGHDLMASSQPNIQGGEDLMTPGHEMIASSHPNIHGGETIDLPTAGPMGAGEMPEPPSLANLYAGEGPAEFAAPALPDPPSLNLFHDAAIPEMPSMQEIDVPTFEGLQGDLGNLGDFGAGAVPWGDVDLAGLEGFDMDFGAFEVPDFDFDFDIDF